MIEEATVDCYNEDEAFMGVVYYLEKKMSFPLVDKHVVALLSKSTGNPIEGATVSADGYSDTTDSVGNYQLSIPVGVYEVTVSAVGYIADYKYTMTVGAGETVLLNLLMEPSSKVLPVPYYHQGDTKWCVPTSMSMILKYHGKNIHSWDIADHWDIGRDDELGISQPVKARGYFIDQGLDTDVD